MGLKLSSCFSKKKSKRKERVEYSPRTTQEMYDARRNAPLIYPPLSSLRDEKPKRSLRPDGGAIYESVHIDSDVDDDDRKYEKTDYHTSRYGRYYKQYDDGLFAVISSQPMNHCGVFRL